MEVRTAAFVVGIKPVNHSCGKLNALLRRQTTLRLRPVCEDQA